MPPTCMHALVVRLQVTGWAVYRTFARTGAEPGLHAGCALRAAGVRRCLAARRVKPGGVRSDTLRRQPPSRSPAQTAWMPAASKAKVYRHQPRMRPTWAMSAVLTSR
jgi:hypothetical protein